MPRAAPVTMAVLGVLVAGTATPAAGERTRIGRETVCVGRVAAASLRGRYAGGLSGQATADSTISTSSRRLGPGDNGARQPVSYTARARGSTGSSTAGSAAW